MKITNYSDEYNINLSGGNGVATYNSEHVSLGSNTPLVESGSGSPGTGPQASAWNHVHPALAGGASFGSNSSRVAATSSAGASSSNSRADHVHDGIGTVTASGSNTLGRGTIGLRAGTNISFGLTDSDGDGLLDLVTINNIAPPGGSASLSYGSNSSRVSSSSAAGASTLVSRADHVHDGVRSVAKSGSAALYGDVTLTGGSNVTLTQSGNDISIASSAGGGGGTSGYDLDQYAIDATYGDDFTGASLSGSWTRRNFTSGAESYQQGYNATYTRIKIAGRVAGDGYFRTAPAGDWTFAMAFVPHFWATAVIGWGMCVVDTAGTGVGTVTYNAPLGPLMTSITTYSTYAGSYTQVGKTGASPNTNIYPVGYWQIERKVWVYLRKSSTSYFTAVSLDGEVWSPESPTALVWAGTVDRVGMFINPLTSGTGVGDGAVVDVDWFNKIA